MKAKIEVKEKKLVCRARKNLPKNVIERVTSFLGSDKDGATKITTGEDGTSSDGTKISVRVFIKKIIVNARTSFDIDANIFDKKKKTGSIFLCSVGKDELGPYEFSVTAIRGKICCRFGFSDLITHVMLHEVDGRKDLKKFLKALDQTKFERTITGRVQNFDDFEKRKAKAKQELIRDAAIQIQAIGDSLISTTASARAEQEIRRRQFLQLRAKKLREGKGKKK
ncbi:MAG: hypothetical protein K0U98_00460 [Deltaproteobacteria bacterium]|nr:hypothetical protein [Deltaproteobacteria bacterium]